MTDEAGVDPNDECWWYPNTPECQTENSNAKIVYINPEGYVSGGEVFLSQLSYMIIALVEVLAAVLITFRYRSQDWNGSTSDSFYKPYETHVGGTNWWSLANMINSYGKLSIFGIAFITQLLATLGIAASINTIIWHWLVIVGVSLINVLYVIFDGLSYDTATDKCRSENVSNACTVQAAIELDFYIFFAMEGFVAATMYTNYSNWLQGQNEAAFDGGSEAEKTEEPVNQEDAATEGDAETIDDEGRAVLTP